MASRHRSHEEASINLTPMIDVVFLLVIFFMVGAKFSESEGRIDVSVAAAGQLQSIARTPDERLVEVDENNVISLDGNVVTKQQLSETLRAQYANYPGLKVAVRVHELADMRQFREVVHLVRQVGVDKLGIAFRSGSRTGVRR